VPIPFELKYNMHIALILICGLAIWHAESANIAIPKSQTSCTAEVKFPVKAFIGLTGYPWYTEAFGVNFVGTNKAKSKLPHLATVFAELIDQDNDGCADDPNIMAAILAHSKKLGVGYKGTILVQEDKGQSSGPFGFLGSNMDNLLNKAKIHELQQLAPFEIKPQCTKAKKFTAGCKDASQEELFHVITSSGASYAYNKIFGEFPTTLNSKVQLAMDKARGGKKILTTPSTLAKYPKSAWYTNIDQSCKYIATDGCQVTEYIWFGFCSYSGLCEKLDAITSEKPKLEFKYLKKSDLLAKDKLLSALFLASTNKTAAYRLPTIAADGKYTGCSKCLRANEISYDGKYYKTGTSATTKKPTVATTKKPTVTTTKKTTVTTDDLGEDYYE
jgi:hypothetical protein